MTRILLVACGKEKMSPGRAWPARDLYIGSGYTDASRYALRELAEERADHWMILSGLHGLVSPDQEIERYERYLPGLPVGERRSWRALVLRQLHGWLPEVGLGARLVDGVRTYPPIALEYHAASAYVVRGGPPSWTVVEPLAGLQQGQRRAWYKRERERLRDTEAVQLGLGLGSA